MSGSPTNWVTGDGDMVSIGDYVALDLDSDAVGRIVAVCGDATGRPLVQVTEGHRSGKRLAVWPTQMLLRVQR
ncbi:hypothetical protein CS0771_57210 [Catellatospora sp. IY07-71]|uniref:hypothetical protein n=1 Tax=Catellatospora sp. IY07-71 TaxID=2728827 RepID=UPI001BB45AC5|nr:hypothetical protein [Catellatospora sp. IY07-71]BCJ76177.1 hypothetical protein CS0771_57210 [Catellatospora sp. IY07-71]